MTHTWQAPTLPWGISYPDPGAEHPSPTNHIPLGRGVLMKTTERTARSCGPTAPGPAPSRPAAGRPQPHSIPEPRVTPKQTPSPPPILMGSAASPPPPRASSPREALGTLLTPLTPLSEIPFIPGDPLYLPGDPHHLLLLFLLLLRRSRLAQAPQPPRREPGTSGSLLSAGPQGVLGIVVSVFRSLPPLLRRVLAAQGLQLL